MVLGKNPELREPKHPVLHLAVCEFRPFVAETPATAFSETVMYYTCEN
jgi:hypothetical protein